MHVREKQNENMNGSDKLASGMMYFKIPVDYPDGEEPIYRHFVWHMDAYGCHRLIPVSERLHVVGMGDWALYDHPAIYQQHMIFTACYQGMFPVESIIRFQPCHTATTYNLNLRKEI